MTTCGAIVSELKIFTRESAHFIRIHYAPTKWINMYKSAPHTYILEAWTSEHEDTEDPSLEDILKSIPGLVVKDPKTIVIDDECMVYITLKYGVGDAL